MILELVSKFISPKTASLDLRQASPSDAEEMRAFFSRFSRETLYLRFHIPYRSVPDWAMKPFLGVGLDGECVVVAVEGERIVGHAMYAVEPDGREAAEVALVVEDDRQGRGVGRLLLREVALRAERRGAETFVCRALRENERVPGLVGSVFGEANEKIEDGLRILNSPLRSLRP